MSRSTLPALLLSLLTLAGCQPDSPPAAAEPTDPCLAPVTGIHAVQGSGARSPKLGERVTIRAIVTTPYLPGLGGFYVQQASDDRDGDPATSEGLFVQADGGTIRRSGSAPTAPDAEPTGELTPGTVLRLTGVVGELGDGDASLTTLTEISERLVCGTAQVPEAASIENGQLVVEDWEAYEGMQVSLDAPLTLIGNEQLFRRGELVVSFSGRQYQPTQRQPPGDGARKLDVANRAARLVLDDRSEAEWPERIRYLPERVAAERPYRVGSAVANAAGILDQRAGQYRLQVEGRIAVEQAPRPPVPEVEGRIRVLSYNVLNLFNGDGDGESGFPTPRGATTPEEFRRQTDKLVATIRAVNADLVGLIEIENDGLEATSALRQFVDALNRGQPRARHYSAVDPGMPMLGQDQISVALIYRRQTLETVGPALAMTEAPFDQRQRAPLLQRFRDKSSGGSFAVVVNHWKSKGGCDDADSANADRGDLQSCWNPTRVDAARALAEWIDRESNVWGDDDDVLILGDLNAYAQEDPLRLLAQQGYERLEPASEPAADYTLSYNAAVGALDHALVSTSLRPQVAGAAIWHINADEMPDFDYNIDKRSKAQRRLYRPDPYRSSDHDPVIVGLNPVK